MCNSYFLKRFYLFISRQRRREGEREGEKYQCVVACLTHPTTGDLAHNPGMCPDRESNWRSFGSQSNTQPTEPHQPELIVTFKYSKLTFVSLCKDLK